MHRLPSTDDRRLQTRSLQILAGAAAVLAAIVAVDAILDRFGIVAGATPLPLLALALACLLLAGGLPLALRGQLATAIVVGAIGLAPVAVAALAPAPAVLMSAAALLTCTALVAATTLPPRWAVLPAAVGVVGFGGALLRADTAAPALAWLGVLAAVSVVTAGTALLAREVRGLARIDPVTLVANRRFWEHTVEHECARAARTDHPLCVAVLVLDDYRQYAFERGHAAAEQVLREAATAWDGQVRGGDLVGRVAPDQLAVLLPECGIAAARLVLERLQNATPPGRTCSAGLAVWDGSESATALVERAAGALRLAQRTGRPVGTIAAA
jgi:diguanylate cyclase